jgi:hypothetical protein
MSRWEVEFFACKCQHFLFFSVRTGPLKLNDGASKCARLERRPGPRHGGAPVPRDEQKQPGPAHVAPSC